MVDIRLLVAGDEALLSSVAPEVFDGPVDPALVAEFLSDPRHHLAAAIADGRVVGMASAVHYVHPDKPPELWINEVGVSPKHRKLGLGRRLLDALRETGRSVGCRAAWVLTDRSNEAARRLYASVGATEATGDPVMFELEIAEAPAERDG